MYICYVSFVVSLSVHKLDNMIYQKVYGSHLTLNIDRYTAFQQYKKHKLNNLSAGQNNYVGNSIKVLSANCQGLRNIEKKNTYALVL